jgi:hypothetical protein
VWLFFTLLPCYPLLSSIIYNPSDILYNVNYYIPNLIGSILVLSVPIIISMTFGAMPFALLRAGLKYKRLELPSREDRIKYRSYALYPDLSNVTAAETAISPSGLLDFVMTGKIITDPRELLMRFANQSSLLAHRVYNRAGVYLMVGVFIAIGGLGFFYLRSLNLPPEKDLMDRALSLLPGFGILFFIEFVALFFLRQHRAAMDDFRYYDAVSRHREENLVILTMFAENATIVPTAEVINAMTIYSGGQKLMQGETTEILEARRLQGDDLVIFEKLIEAFSAAKAAARGPTKTRLGASRNS